MLKTRLRSGFPVADSFVFEFKSEDEARGCFACEARSVLQTLKKWHCNWAVARVDGQSDILVPIATIELMAEFEPIVELFFADTSLPPVVLRAAVEKQEEESRFGVVRLSDDQQVIISSGMGGVLLAGVGISDTTKKEWRRPNFWHPEDLNAFNRDWQRQLSVESNGELEYRYRIHKPNSNDPYEYYRSSFRLLQTDRGELFHIGTFIDRE